jgi:hypothetical protein
LNRYPSLKQIIQDIGRGIYENINIEYVPGAPPGFLHLSLNSFLSTIHLLLTLIAAYLYGEDGEFVRELPLRMP